MRRSVKKNVKRFGKLLLCVAIANFTVNGLAQLGSIQAQEQQDGSVILTDSKPADRVAANPSASINATSQPVTGSAATLEPTPLMPRKVAAAEVSSHSQPQQDSGDCYLVPTACLTPTMSLPELHFGQPGPDVATFLPPDQPQVPWRDEVLIDGGDRNLRVQVLRDWSVNGLDIEDTIAHFDTLGGKRLIQPSNRVGIYAPRFKAVRKITNLVDSQVNLRMAQIEEQTKLHRSQHTDFSTTTVQHLQPRRNRLAMSPSGFRDQTRGVLADNVMHLSEFANGFQPFENFQTIRFGRYVSSEKARLSESIQRAVSWAGDLAVLSTVANLRLIESKETTAFQISTGVKNQVDKPAIRLVKVASKMAAEVGEEVEFTLRFDNVGNQTIGYVPGSGQCSLDASLVAESNEAGSSKLRWEIAKPLDVGEGGIIRFKCIVR